MKQTISSMQMQPGNTVNNQHLLIYESNRQYSTIVAMNRGSGSLSFLVLSKERKNQTTR